MTRRLLDALRERGAHVRRSWGDHDVIEIDFIAPDDWVCVRVPQFAIDIARMGKSPERADAAEDAVIRECIVDKFRSQYAGSRRLALHLGDYA